MKNRRKIILASGISILSLVVLTMVFKEQLLFAFGNYLIVQDDLQPADVIHVIAGDDYRSEYAIELYKQGYAKNIFFTGGWCESHKYNHGIHGQELALSLGVPQDAIFYDDSTVTSTYSEAVLLKAWIDQNTVPIQSVMVVSDPFHMRRSEWTYRNVLGKGIKLMMSPVPFERTPYQQEWWTDYKSQRYVSDEYLKSLYYLFRYKFSWGPFRTWLASYDR